MPDANRDFGSDNAKFSNYHHFGFIVGNRVWPNGILARKRHDKNGYR